MDPNAQVVQIFIHYVKHVRVRVIALLVQRETLLMELHA